MSTQAPDRPRPLLRLVPATGAQPAAQPASQPAAGATRAVANEIEDRYLSPAALQAMIRDAAIASERGELTCSQAASAPVEPAEPTTAEPAAPSAARTRPMKLVDLEGVPQAAWHLVPDVVYLWQQRRWKLEKIGCVMCVQDDEGGRTLATVDGGDEDLVCTTHGELFEVSYSLKKVYTLQIGGIEREGEEVVRDTMLFPCAQSATERLDLINKILDEAQRDEQDELEG